MSRRKKLSVEEYRQGILAAKTSVLSQAITLVESKNIADRKLAGQLLDSILPHTCESIRIGITGVPGVGKSTFIESFGSMLTTNGNRVAVLAVDPTSKRSGGSILGDKTRMDKLSADPNAFIRPSAAGSYLGGVASATREAMLLCEAAGYNIIIIETVGVGQSETAVRDMVDFFLLLMLAGAGDELQGIKRGIMEMADTVVINKADQENITAAKRARAEYQTALHYLPPASSQWQPRVHTCSALEDTGIEEVWKTITDYISLTKENSFFNHQRQQQNLHWLHEKLNFLLKERFYSQSEFKEALQGIEKKVADNTISPSSGAQELAELLNQ